MPGVAFAVARPSTFQGPLLESQSVVSHDVSMQVNMRGTWLRIWLAGVFGGGLSLRQQHGAGRTLFAERCAVGHGALLCRGSAPALPEPPGPRSATVADL